MKEGLSARALTFSWLTYAAILTENLNCGRQKRHFAVKRLEKWSRLQIVLMDKIEIRLKTILVMIINDHLT
jgi:hypothetical protein